MRYEFKHWPELLWGLAVAVMLGLAQMLIAFDPTTVEDWRLWAISLAGGVVRVFAGYIIAKLGPGGGNQ